MSPLAALGGRPAIAAPLPAYPSIGPAEKAAVARVMDSGVLSGFHGVWGDRFDGGPEVRALEAEWAARFGARHVVSVNSATSALVAAMGAIGLSPGDEVILAPTTMSATAMAPLAYGGIPVFADIEAETFCLDPAAVAAAITPRTRAILATNLFGHPAALAQLRALADRHGIYLVEDNAQGPLAAEHGRLAGTIGHIGVFSLNYHKHIHAGEGGLCATADDGLALRLRLIRNHGENAVAPAGVADLTNMVGWNLRLSELHAAIARAQLAAIDSHVAARERIAARLSAGLSDLEGLAVPAVRAGCRHVYYVWAMQAGPALGIDRERFARGLKAEGFPCFTGYVAPLYRLPLFQQRRAIGRDGFPFTLGAPDYREGLCPVAERLHRDSLIGFEPCAYDLDDAGVDRLVGAVRKVHAHRHDLRALN